MDAIRKPVRAEPGERGSVAATEDAVDRLRSAGVTGELVYVGEESCRRRAIALPTLAPAGNEPGCSLQHTVSPDGRLSAECGYTVASIFERRTERTLYQVAACPVAWRPDGVLTGAVGAKLLRFAAPCPERAACAQPLIDAAELELAGRRHPNVPDAAEVDVEIADVVWLTSTRAVLRLGVVVRGRLERLGPQPVIAFFESARLVHTAAFFHDDTAQLRPSPSGAYVALAPGLVLRRDGSEASLPPQLVRAHAVAWSPDERWLALAQRGNVVLVEMESLERYDRTGGDLRTIAVPVTVRDLLWR
ncbi:MAG: hypothetical protein H0T13_05905 [Actinobacteria bacterium]|nr:hypothetical protein [Actinomycetota bacterium]